VEKKKKYTVAKEKTAPKNTKGGTRKKARKTGSWVVLCWNVFQKTLKRPRGKGSKEKKGLYKRLKHQRTPGGGLRPKQKKTRPRKQWGGGGSQTSTRDQKKKICWNLLPKKKTHVSDKRKKRARGGEMYGGKKGSPQNIQKDRPRPGRNTKTAEVGVGSQQKTPQRLGGNKKPGFFMKKTLGASKKERPKMVEAKSPTKGGRRPQMSENKKVNGGKTWKERGKD